MRREYVIDANGKEIYSLLFSQHRIYLPDFAFSEIDKYKERILKKTRLDQGDFQEFVLRLLRDVTVIPSLLISQTSLSDAYRLCKDIDEKDTIYLAVTIELGAVLITNDKALYGELRRREFPDVVLWTEVVENLAAVSE
ncbi:MAG: hypothetical protein GY856_27730 [bacterium]|nr:hypothetical protein [bacterium]